LVVLHAIACAQERNGRISCTDQVQQKHNALGVPLGEAVICFQAFISNFDTRRMDGRALGVPRWVSYELDKGKPSNEKGQPRPSWYTVQDLVKENLAPTTASYATSVAFRRANDNWYQRGHLAPKFLAERLGVDAGRYSHNVVNAVPQREIFNKGPWYQLECQTGAWANEYEAVWIIAGPIFIIGRPSAWLEPDDEMPVKIVARRLDPQRYEVVGFVYPQESPLYLHKRWDSTNWQTPIERIEQLTGLHLRDAGVQLEELALGSLWPLNARDFDRGCLQFAPD
jgi:DNA/RNA endonuclease G (NUC1)